MTLVDVYPAMPAWQYYLTGCCSCWLLLLWRLQLHCD
jgi:hypothetical protein